MDEPTEGMYYMILRRDLLTAMVIYLKFSKEDIIVCDRPYQGCKASMAKMSTYNY